MVSFMSNIVQRLGNLITIKSIVTIILTIVFSILSIRGDISADLFMQIFVMVIAFYYGTTKRDDTNTDISNKSGN